jgi:hypothetical protein
VGAAVPPLALLLTVELISRVLAAWLSYWHMVGVASRYGETEAAASYLLPLSVDGLVIVASVSLVEITRTHPQRHPPASRNADITGCR